MMRKPQPFISLKDGEIAIDYLTTFQYGGRDLPKSGIMRAAFFSLRLPGKCAHFVVNLTAEANNLIGADLAEWLFQNMTSAQHIRTCDVVKDSP